MTSRFFDVGRCQINSNPAYREGEFRILDSRTNPFPTLLDRGVAQSDNGKARNSRLGIDFDVYGQSEDALEYHGVQKSHEEGLQHNHTIPGGIVKEKVTKNAHKSCPRRGEMVA